MAATSPLARSLLALACFALLVAACTADRRTMNLPNCAEYLAGDATKDVIILDQRKTRPYQENTRIDNNDNCLLKGSRLVGAMIMACDPLGPPPPSVLALSTLSQQVECHTDGPCPAGLVVSVSQYCAPL